jgi:hypothetical protein
MFRALGDVAWMLCLVLVLIMINFPTRERLIKWCATLIAVAVVALGFILP